MNVWGIPVVLDPALPESAVVIAPQPVNGVPQEAIVIQLDLDPTQEHAKRMFNFTSPNEKKIEFYIEERDGVFVIFSKAYPITRDGKGAAHNYVAEKPTREEAEDLIQRIRNLH